MKHAHHAKRTKVSTADFDMALQAKNVEVGVDLEAKTESIHGAHVVVALVLMLFCYNFKNMICALMCASGGLLPPASVYSYDLFPLEISEDMQLTFLKGIQILQV